MELVLSMHVKFKLLILCGGFIMGLGSLFILGGLISSAFRDDCLQPIIQKKVYVMDIVRKIKIEVFQKN